MTPQRLLQHFEQISDAPDAIAPLRRFILDLAVRGKLVEQDPRDEPASELLKRIQAEKARLVYAGEIKKGKPLPDIEEDEIPFGIPANWQWVRLNDITSYIQRGKSPEYTTGEGLPVISQKCVQWGGLDLDSAKSITPESIEEYEPIRFLRRDDLLWNSTGTGTIGRVVKVKEPPRKLVCDSHVTVVRCLEVDAEYIRSWLRSDHVYAVIEDQAAGSTNQVELTSQLAMNQVVPLPPLAEQQRIVAKVDELMVLCDRLETAQTERERRRDRLVASSLNRLNNGEDVDAFRDHARFYFNHLPRLTTKPGHIQQLRQTILNLAVRGKLVPQDPNDEAASELLRRMGAEKSQNEPFLIPISWAWVSVDQVGDSRLGKMLDKGKNKGTPRRYLRNVNVRWFDFDLSDVFEMPFEDDELEEFALHRDDVLICEGGEPGRTAVWDEREQEIYFQKAIHRVRFSEGVTPHFFVNAVRESADSGRLSTYFTGVGIKHFTGKGLASYTFPLPSLAEQQRIVAKVDELMALCDKLDAQLTTTHTDRRRLLEAVLHEALAPAV
ncbi:MAG: restriction endonuclease subunit S [Nitrospira sp. LK70]|nr:restriction endonuclease subunit S [Nitrospira sp. LK70]